MASRSVLMNGLQDRVKIINGDAQNAHETFGASSFDVVVSNPPYMKNQHGLKNEEDAKQIARHEICGNLEDFIRETAKVLKPKGRCYFVHRPFRIVDLMELMRKYKIEPKKMQLVHPYVDHEPNMVLIEGVRGGNPWLKVEPPLIVYDKPNVYSEEALRIYGK
jgi:tRNA1Val (adenine37-N6)-methyltransferase